MQSGAFLRSVLAVALAAVLEGGALSVGAAVSLVGALADLDGLQRAVALVTGVMSTGLDGTSDFVIDMIHS